MVSLELDSQQKEPVRLRQLGACLGEHALIVEAPGFSAGGLPRWNRVQRFREWESLRQEFARLPPTAVVFVEIPSSGSERTLGEVFELVAAYPSAAVVAVIDEMRPQRVADVRALLDHGISEVLSLSLDTTPERVGLRVHAAMGRPFKRRLEAVLPLYVSAEARVLLRAAAAIAVIGGDARDLGSMFSVSARTVAAWCDGAGLPKPRRLQAWLRALLAAFLLGDRGRTLQGVAAVCGYSHDRALRKLIGSLLGTGASSLKCSGAFRIVAAAFNAELREVRFEQSTRPPRKATKVVPMRES